MMERVVAFVAGTVLGAASLYGVLKSYTTPEDVTYKRQISEKNPSIPDVVKRVLPFGDPSPISETKYRETYISSYNRQLRNPIWAAEHITRESLKHKEGVDRSHSSFLEDETIPKKFRALLSDYFRSGFDRGHLVPAADARESQKAMNDTFYLTNMSPQVGQGFNRDYWAHFESFVRDLTRKFPDVYVFTGPLYLPRLDSDGNWYVKYQMIGNPPNVAVPTHFYKVILTHDPKSDEFTVGSFVLPNAPILNETPLEQFLTSLESVEKQSGVEFFNKLDRKKLQDLCARTKCSLDSGRFDKFSKNKR